MGSFSIWHWLIVLLVVAILFGGGGKLSRLMGDMGKGMRSFQKNIKGQKIAVEDNDDEDNDTPKSIKKKRKVRSSKSALG